MSEFASLLPSFSPFRTFALSRLDPKTELHLTRPVAMAHTVVEVESMRGCVVLSLLVLFMCSSAFCQTQIPPESLDALQGMFAEVRDGLWLRNDEFWHHGEFERSIATLRLMAEIDPHDTEAYENAAWLMGSALRDDEAEAFLRKGLANTTDTYDLYFTLGQFCYVHERFDEAVDYLMVATCFPDIPEYVWHSLAHAYESAGLTTDALDIWLQREALDPDDAVPGNQIDRILRGGPPSGIPRFMTRAREQRKAEEQKGSKQ